MMNKKGIAVWVILFASMLQTLSGQTTATISGRIIDGTTSESIPFASIVLLNSDTVMTAGTLSEEDGRFTLDGISKGARSLKLVP